MKILFVVEHFPCLSETFVLNQVTGLLDLGHDVKIYAVGKPSGTVTHEDVKKYRLMARTCAGGDVPVRKLHRLSKAIGCFPAFFRRLGLRGFKAFNPFLHGKKAINLGFFYSCLPLVDQETSFDIIHCHFGDKGLLALAWRDMGLVAGAISTVFHAHEIAGISDVQGKRLYSPLFKSNTLLLPISERWRQRLINWGANPERNLVHHMGVNLEQFHFAPYSSKPDLPIQILSVGRLTEQKGYESAIRAVVELRSLIPHKFQYTIIGSGELESSLIQLVEELGAGDLVTFAGQRSQCEVSSQIKKTHVFLLPSVTAHNGFQEGIPVALMEAMASGLPVITTRHSGIPELVENEVSGLLVDEWDIQGLAQAMARFLSDPELASRVGAAGRKVVEASFEIRKLNLQLQDIFRREAKKYLPPAVDKQ